jgi:hypothetical protein
VAVYEATGELAPGVHNEDAVFRDEVAGAPLVAAGFTSPGDTSVDLDVHGTGGRLRFVFYCTTQDDPLWVNVSVDGGSLMANGCEDNGADAGAGGNWGITRFPAGDHRVRVYLTDPTSGSEVAPADGVVFGVGIYDPPAAWPRVVGDRAVDTHVEYAGRDWVLDEVVGAPTMLDTTDGDVLLGLVGTGHRVGAQWSGRLTQGETPRIDSPDDANTTLGGVLLAGDRYDVTITGGKGSLLVYRPV